MSKLRRICAKKLWSRIVRRYDPKNECITRHDIVLIAYLVDNLRKCLLSTSRSVGKTIAYPASREARKGVLSSTARLRGDASSNAGPTPDHISVTETSTPFSPSAGLTGPNAREAWFRRIRPGVAISVLAAAASAILTGAVLVVLTGADDVLQVTVGASVARSDLNSPALALLAVASSGLVGVAIGRCIWHRS